MSNENYLPVNFPSKCLPYSGVDPSQIRVRPFNGADEVLLAQMNFSNLESKFCEVLGRVVTGIDPKLLTLGDRMYLMLWLCINSYTELMNFTSICAHCLKGVTLRVDLRQIENETLEDSFVPDKDIILSTGETVKVRLLSLGDMVSVERYESDHSEGSHLYKYALTLVSEKPIIERIAFLEKLIGKDMAKIRAFQRKYAHGPIMYTSTTCPECGKVGDFELPFRLEILFPTGETLTDSHGEGI